jgi:hypothetical protein
MHTAVTSEDLEKRVETSVFGQMCAALRSVSPSQLRTAKPTGSEPFVGLEVLFEGESAEVCGRGWWVIGVNR